MDQYKMSLVYRQEGGGRCRAKWRTGRTRGTVP